MSEIPGDSTGADSATRSGAQKAPGAQDAQGANATPGAAAPKPAAGKRVSLRSPTDALQPEAPPPPPDPKPKKRRDSSLTGAVSGVLSFVVVLGLIALGVVAYGVRRFDAPGPLPADKIVLIQPRSGVGDILAELEREGVIDDATILRGAIYAQNLQGKVRAGEYQFKAHASPREVLATIMSGRSIQHSLTLPEGLTSDQIVERLRENDVLVGDVREAPKEGLLAPDTYKFNRGMTREQFLGLMKRRQAELLEKIWEGRDPDLPVKSSYELLTLASIIEKETGKADERPHVAAVFVNRLKKRMRLQSDPTIVYGLVGGKGGLGRGITRAELTRPTSYNTYIIDGLPPGPICNPGRAALEAAAHPLASADLYFVADGSGGHVFSSTLEQHNRNVQRWREIERQAKQPAADTVEPDAQAPAEAPQSAPAGARPRRRGELDAGPVFGALPDRLGVNDVALAALAAGPDLARVAARLLGDRPAGPVESGRDWAGRIEPLAFAAAVDKAAPAPGLAAIEAAAPAPAPAPDSAPAPASPYAFGSAVEDFKVVGVNTTSGYLDMEPDPEAAAGPDATMQTFPVKPALLAEMRAKAAQYGLAPTGTGGIRALPILDAPVPAEPAATKPSERKRPSVIDASEGTRLDPLKNTTYDLSSSKTIPNLRLTP